MLLKHQGEEFGNLKKQQDKEVRTYNRQLGKMSGRRIYSQLLVCLALNRLTQNQPKIDIKKEAV